MIAKTHETESTNPGVMECSGLLCAPNPPQVVKSFHRRQNSNSMRDKAQSSLRIEVEFVGILHSSEDKLQRT